MNTHAGGRQRRSFLGPHATVLGSITVPGSPQQVSVARKFVARTLDRMSGLDSDAATLLTSEVVTNAIQHTSSGAQGGTVSVVVVCVPNGVLIEVIDDGSHDTPVVKGEPFTPEGHGLFLVQQIAARWGYLRDPAGTTVWFRLEAGGEMPRARTPGEREPGWQPAAIPG